MTAPARRPAFTLFELILAIALSATLLALIGTAVNLYLVRVDVGRTRVEEAQLARSVLATIAADVRAAAAYQTQDTSALAQLAASVASFDVDQIDQSGEFGGSAVGTPSSSSSGEGGSAAGGTSSSTSSTGTSLGEDQSSTTLLPGVNGTLEELILDVSRLPRLDELFPTAPAQQAATLAAAINMPRPSDVKSIRYFVRQGEAADPSDPAATSLAPEAQLRLGGLVRQTMDRAVRVMAEQSGNSALLASGQALLAPEVVHVEFRYFDGATAVDEWNMQQQNSLPPAIEVRIWFAPSGAPTGGPAAYGGSADLANARMYSQTIELPLYQSGGAAASSSTGTEGFGSDAGDAEGPTQ